MTHWHYADHSGACSPSTFGTVGIMVVDPAEMNLGDRRVAADCFGGSMSCNTKSTKPNAQQSHPTIMKTKDIE